MTMEEHDPLAGHPDLMALGATPQLPPPRPTRRMLPWVIGAGAVVAVAFALVIWWILATTVSTSAYDEVVADLAATEAEFDSAERIAGEQMVALNDEIAVLDAANEELQLENDGLDEQLAAATTQIGALTDERDDLRLRVGRVESAADAMAYSFLNIDRFWFAELRAGGAAVEPYDEVLALLGHDQGIEAWLADSDAWFHVNAAIARTDDEALIDAWNDWNDTQVDSIDDWIAWGELNARLNSFLLENASDVDPLAGTVRAINPDDN